jgi:hypothetical protein
MYNKAMKDKHKANKEGDPDVSQTISNIGEQAAANGRIIRPVQINLHPIEE